MRQFKQQHRKSHNSGYTLIELVVGMVASSALLIGLSSSLFIATQTFDDSGSQPVAMLESNNVANLIMNQMQYATRFYEKTATAVTFAVPDRDGDGSEEIFRYAWSGVTDEPLTMELNDSAPAVLLANVKHLDFSYLTKSISVATGSVSLQVHYEGMAETFVAPKQEQIILSLPASTAEDDLLVAVVVTDGNRKDSLTTAVGGWNVIAIDNVNSGVTLGVWWKIAASGESAPLFTWSGKEEAYGWIMRFTNHDPTSPIKDWAIQTTAIGESMSPVSPAVAPMLANSLVLRVAGFEHDHITVGQPGLTGHTVITMQKSSTDSGAVSGAAGYFQQATLGNTGTSTFAITDEDNTVAITLAIGPQEGSP